MNIHKFHIPVLGTGFSVDTPVKVAKYGISSVVSLVDDQMMEKLREFYSNKFGYTFQSISEKEDDARAKRVTAYLNTINKIVNEKFEELKNSNFEKDSEITKYFEMLDESHPIKSKYNEMLTLNDPIKKVELQNWLKDNIKQGSIDVNIMTKLDKVNYDNQGDKLPNEFNDANASLRGFANSDLENSSVIFSAGMNPRLYGYMETFKDFYPDQNGEFKKKIVLKVSDFRSALIQGKFLAKKGLWVSEYRIESGLNCGGHAFATDGYLMGPILQEFKNRKEELLNIKKEICYKVLDKKEILYNDSKMDFRITVQGGIGNSKEQEFLIKHYGVDSVGWGSPFLLVPEVMNVDDNTLGELSKAGVDDIYLSKVSPLGVPFNNLRRSEKEIEKQERIEDGKPGSPCPKKYLVSNTEFTDKPICSASISYLNKKITDLKNTCESELNFKDEFKRVVDKACLCVGLAASVMKVNNIETPKTSRATAICPGPNLAYFSKIVSLKEMVDHIYGKHNLITDPNRPNMFIKELNLYIDYLKRKFEESIKPISEKTEEYLDSFKHNLIEGINYYKELIPHFIEEKENVKEKIKADLEMLEEKLLALTFNAVVGIESEA